MILFCCVIGFVLPLRPEISDLESRRLTEFPEFDMEDFVSGKYTSDINLWYSDTFPGRDWLVERNGDLKNLYGIKTTAFDSGSGNKDEINMDETFIWDDSGFETTDTPDSGTTTPDDPEITMPNDPEETTCEDPETTTDGTGTAAPDDSDTTTSETSAPDTPDKPDTPDTPTEDEPIIGETIDGYYVKGDTAYQLYYFNKQNADRYARSVMNLAIKLKGLADVYSMIAPTSSVIGLSDKEIEVLGMSNGKDGIEYIHRAIAAYSEQLMAMDKISSPVQTIGLYDCLNAHRDEYIFYRTDHHWTGLGAYYASRYFLDTVGKSYPSLDQYKEIKIDGFLGTLYSYTQNANLKNHPDTVYAYESPTVKNFQVLYKDATALKVKPIINPNVTSSNKYLCFITGDRPYSVIHNETINDGSSILIIKDSFGNAFSPMLADSYEYVHIIDYRHWSGDLAEFVQENNIDTVLLLLNIRATASDTSMGNLENFLKNN